MSTIVQKNVSELKPHPRNEEIYGANESIDVNCEVKEFDNEWEELEYLVINNNSREKTVEQKAREAKCF